MDVEIEWGFLECILNMFYDLQKAKKASTNPNEYQRGLDDGRIKGRMDACKELETIIAEQIGKEFSEGFLNQMKHTMVNVTFIIKGDPRLEFGEVEIRYGPGVAHVEPLGREVIRFWGISGDPRKDESATIAHLFWIQQASNWETKLLDSTTADCLDTFDNGELRMKFSKEHFWGIWGEVEYPEFRVSQTGRDGLMEYSLWMDFDLPVEQTEWLGIMLEKGKPLMIFESIQAADEPVINALERFAVGMKLIGAWFREYLASKDE